MKHIGFLLPPGEPYSPRGLALTIIVRHVAAELRLSGQTTTIFTVPDPLGLYCGEDLVEIPLDTAPTLAARALKRIESRAGRRPRVEKRWVRSAVAAIAKSYPDCIVAMNDLTVNSALATVRPEIARFTWLENELPPGDESLSQASEGLHRLFACSNHIANHARCRGVPADLVATLHNGVDTSAFTPSPRVPSSSGELRLLFVGRLDPNKGPDAVVDAFHVLREEGLPVTLTLAGPKISYSLGGAAYERWSSQLLAKAAAAGAQYLGPVSRDRLPGVYREHDVALFPSRSQEPFGLVALEALAAGCLVVSSERGGLPEATGGFALYADPDSPYSIGRVLRDIVLNRSSFERLRTEGSEWAATRSWKGVAQRLLELIEEPRREQ